VVKWLFNVTLRPGARSQALQLRLKKWVKLFAVTQAKVFHILMPGSTAFKEQLMLVNGFERYYPRIHALKKKANYNS
jgi:hypothetical protein